jgi:hypothetical protein
LVEVDDHCHVPGGGVAPRLAPVGPGEQRAAAACGGGGGGAEGGVAGSQPGSWRGGRWKGGPEAPWQALVQAPARARAAARAQQRRQRAAVAPVMLEPPGATHTERQPPKLVMVQVTRRAQSCGHPDPSTPQRLFETRRTGRQRLRAPPRGAGTPAWLWLVVRAPSALTFIIQGK